MSNPWDDYKPAAAPAPAASGPWDDFGAATQAPAAPEKAGLARKAGDLGLSVAKGIVQLPSTAAGLADVVTAGQFQVGKKLADNVPVLKKAEDYLTERQTDDLKQGREAISGAYDAAGGGLKGVGNTVVEALSNPGAVLNVAAESLPGMVAGGLAGMGAKAALPALGRIGGAALGEGAVAAGAAAEGIRSQTDDGTITPGQAGIAGLTGAAVMGLGAAGGKLAKTLGVGDPDTMLVAGSRALEAVPGAPKQPMGLAARTGAGALTEGVFEELPQSLVEQGLQNVALDRPLEQGMAEAGVMGAAAGGLFGGAAGALSQPTPAPAPPPAGPVSRALGAMPQLPAPTVRVDAQGNARMDGVVPPLQDEGAANVVGRVDPMPGQPLPQLPAPVARVDGSGGVRMDGQPPQYPRTVTQALGMAQGGTGRLVASPDGTLRPETALEGVNLAQRNRQSRQELDAENERRVELGLEPIQPDGTILDNGRPFPTLIKARAEARRAGADWAPRRVDGGFIVARGDEDVTDVQAKEPGWSAFPVESGTRGIPRAEMPQIKAEHRGPMVNFLGARGITHETVELAASELKPTQAEYSPEKVGQAREFKGGERSILVSSDGHILDGHHQWLAKVEAGEPVKAIRLNAPIEQLLEQVKEFPSAQFDQASAPAAAPAAADPPAAPPAPAAAAEPAASGLAGPADTPEQRDGALTPEQQQAQADLGGVLDELRALAPEVTGQAAPQAQPQQEVQAPQNENQGAAIPAGTATAPNTEVQAKEASGPGQQQGGPASAPDLYGRNGAPIKDGKGRPFKTRIQAKAWQKQTGTKGRVIQHGDGFAVRQFTTDELDNFDQAGKRRRDGARRSSYDKNPFLTFLAEHGLYHVKGEPRSQKVEFSPDRQLTVPGYNFVFRADGKLPDALLQPAIEDGYLPQGASEAQLEELIQRVVRGERVAPLYGHGQMQEEAERELAQDFDDEPQGIELSEDFDPFAPSFDDALEATADDLLPAGFDQADLADTGYDALASEGQARIRALLALAQAQGIDTETILEDAHNATRNEPDQAYYEAAHQALEQALARGNQDRSEDSGQQGQARSGQQEPAAQDEPVSPPAAPAPSDKADTTLVVGYETPFEAVAVFTALQDLAFSNQAPADPDLAQVFKDKSLALGNKLAPAGQQLLDRLQKLSGPGSADQAQTIIDEVVGKRPFSKQQVQAAQATGRGIEVTDAQARANWLETYHDEGLEWETTEGEPTNEEIEAAGRVVRQGMYVNTSYGTHAALEVAKVATGKGGEYDADGYVYTQLQLKFAGTKKKAGHHSVFLRDGKLWEVLAKGFGPDRPALHERVYVLDKPLPGGSTGPGGQAIPGGPTVSSKLRQELDAERDNEQALLDAGTPVPVELENGSWSDSTEPLRKPDARQWLMRTEHGAVQVNLEIAADSSTRGYFRLGYASSVRGTSVSETGYKSIISGGHRWEDMQANPYAFAVQLVAQLQAEHLGQQAKAKRKNKIAEGKAKKEAKDTAELVAMAHAELKEIGVKLDRGQGGNPGRKVSKSDENKLRTRMQALKEYLQAADKQQAAAEVVNGRERDPSIPADECLLLMSCGDAKLNRRARADELYTGPMWQTLRAQRVEGASPRLGILSAEHGLVAPDLELDPYDREMTEGRAAEFKARARDLARGLASRMRGDRKAPLRDVQLVGSKLYRSVMRAIVVELQEGGVVAEDASIREVDGDLLDQRKQLGEYLRGFAQSAPVSGLLSDAEQAALGVRHSMIDAQLDTMSDDQVRDLYRRAGLAGANRPVDALRATLKKEHPDDIEPLLDYNAWVRSQEQDAENRRMQGERVIRQANGKPFKTRDTAKTAQDRNDLGMTHTIEAVEGGFELRLLPPAAQAEGRRKAEGRESYMEAQTAVLAEMGIGEDANGEIDATEAQWEEIERRTEARMRGESASPATPQQLREPPAGDLLGDTVNESQQAAARLRKQKEDAERARANSAPAPDGFGLDMVDSRNGRVVDPGQQDLLGGLDEPAPANPELLRAQADLQNALADLGELLTKPHRSNITPEVEAKLVPILTRLFDAAFRLGHIKFKQAAKFALDTIRTQLGQDFADAITIDHLQGAYIAMGGKYRDRGADTAKTVVAVESKEDIEAATPQEPSNAPSTDASVERPGSEPANQPAVGEPVSGDGPGVRPGGGGGGRGGRGGRGRQQDGAGVSPGGPAVVGERGDQQLPAGEQSDGPAPSNAGIDLDNRGGDVGDDGVPPEPAAGPETRGPSALDAGQKRAAQRRAESVPVKVGDLENVRATLPFLLPGQQEDVHKAETRFAKPDGYGMLFTNGTGTGKTFSGLGIVKRFARQGKTNILVVVPDEKIASDWIESGEPLDLTLTKLADTKTAGKGMVITTYANLQQNNELARRQWDLIVADEAHKLMQAADGNLTGALSALRAIGYHADAAYTRHAMLNAELVAELKAVADELNAEMRQLQLDTAEQAAARNKVIERLQARLNKLNAEDARLRDEAKADVLAKQGAPRPRVAFLSATPFAYDKTVDWANGFLFDYREGYPHDETSLGYNTPNPREHFFITHFGYRMRVGKLTQPDAEVDNGLMERQFNTWLKQQGVLSSRLLDVAADYDRRFVLVSNQIGNRIDEALEWVRDTQGKDDQTRQGLYALSDILAKKFDHLQRRYLLEAIKAKEAIPIVKQHLALGRKVVVFHDYKKGGAVNPFALEDVRIPTAGGHITPEDVARAEALAGAVSNFRAAFPDLVRGDAFKDLASPIDAFSAAFRPDVELLLINGDEKKSDLLRRYKRFQDDGSGPQVALVQSAKNAGWSGHDTTGKHQRVLLNLGLPTQPTMTIQQEGRIYRTGQVSDAIFRYFNTGTNWERWAFASTIAQRASSAENLSLGELARALKDAYIVGFEEADAYPPGHEGEGTGGKERDKAANNAISEYDRAKSFYFANQKKTSRTKAQEGKDYFATPEPLGLKMVHWASVHRGEDVLEPSAGHGAIARWLPEHANRTAIEPSTSLAPRLALGFNGKLVRGVFEDHHVSNKYDAIVMNPPFGLGGKDAIDHLARAATHLREGGRIVALIPTGPAADKRLDAFLYPTKKDAKEKHPSDDLQLIADIKLPMVTFERAGTQVATHVIVLQKGGVQMTTRERDLTDADTIAELFDRLENLDLPARPEPAPKEASAASMTWQDGREAGAAAHAAGEPNRVPADIAGNREAARGWMRGWSEANVAQPVPGVSTAAHPDSIRLPAAAPAAPAAAPAAPAQRPRQDGADGKKLAKRPEDEWVEVITRKGKTLRGILRPDFTQAQAKAYDEYTYQPRGKAGGWFIREAHVSDGEAPAFRQAAPGARANPASVEQAERLQLFIDGIASRWSNKPTITVVDSIHNPLVPQAVRDAPGSDRGKAVFVRGEVFLFADKLANERDALEAVYHEVLGHYGLRAVFGPELAKVLEQVKNLRGADIDKMLKHMGVKDTAANRRRAAEEVLAYLAQSRPEMGLVRSAIAAIRTWLRANVPGFEAMRMTDDELVRNFILPARGFVERGPTPDGTPGQARRGLAFSHSAMKSVDANERRGRDAMNRALNERADQHRAMFRAGLGWVDFVWGDDKKGLQHVFKQRGEKDAMTEAEVTDLLVNRLVPAIARGAEVRRATFDGSVRAVVELDGHQAILVRNVGSNTWLLNGWRKKEPSGAPAAANDTVGLRTPAADSSDGRVGAEDSDESVAPADKPVFSQAPSLGTLTPEQERALKKVGGITTPKTLAQRWAEFSANLGTRVRQGLVDQFAAIKEVDQGAYLLARMSKGADGTMEAALLYGKPVLRDGVPDVDVNGGGFAKVLASLKGEHDRFLWWVAAHRAERLMADGRENLMDITDIADLKSLADGAMPDGAARRQLYDAALKELNDYNDAVLQMAEESGLIDPEARQLFKDQPYVPFYRVMDDGDAQGPKFSSGLVNQKAWKKLKGGTSKLNADLLENMLLNWSHLYTAAARNRAAVASIDAGQRLGIAYTVSPFTKNNVKVMRGGVAEFYAIEDPYLFEAVNAINWTASPLMKPLQKMKQVLTWSVTVNPAFKVRNLLRDSVSAMAQADLSYNPFKNVAAGWKASSMSSQTYASMLASGGLMRFGTAEDTDRIRHKINQLGGVVLDSSGLQTLTRSMQQLWDAYGELGDRTENANRAALYERLVAKGHSHAEAAFLSRDLMDFSMSGRWEVVRFLGQTVPFLNARLQGLYKLGRAASEDPKRFATVAGAVALASVGLMAAYSDDEDWKRREDWDRDSYWWFKIGGTAYRIPKPFEVGAIGTLAERTAELMFSREMTAGRFGDRLAHMVSQTFALNPVPQAFSPLVDVFSNRDNFTGRPIESFGDERIRPEDRFNERTSEIARLLGRMGLPEPLALVKGTYNELSPKQWDYLLRGYFGWVGGSIASVTDYAVRPMLDRGERPDLKLRGGFVEPLPAGGSRYVTTFYEQARDIEQAFASYRQAMKDGDTERAASIAGEGKVQNRIAAGRVRQRMDELNAQAKRIEGNRELSGEQKRVRLNELDALRHQIASAYVRQMNP